MRGCDGGELFLCGARLQKDRFKSYQILQHCLYLLRAFPVTFLCCYTRKEEERCNTCARLAICPNQGHFSQLQTAACLILQLVPIDTAINPTNLNCSMSWKLTRSEPVAKNKSFFFSSYVNS